MSVGSPGHVGSPREQGCIWPIPAAELSELLLRRENGRKGTLPVRTSRARGLLVCSV